MGLYELEPKYKIGPVEIGTKVGKQITGSSMSVQETGADGEYEALVATGREPNGITTKWEKRVFPWGQYSGMAVLLTGPDSLKPLFWSDNDIYGYVQKEDGELTKEAINKHPVIGKKIRWVPSSQDVLLRS